MFRWSINLLAFGVFQASLANPWPEPLRITSVVVEDAALPASVAQKTKEGLETFLQSSPSYSLLKTSEAEQRLGTSPDRLSDQCATDSRCWSRACERLGVDLIIHLEVGFSGSREQAFIRLHQPNSRATPSLHQYLLPRGGGVPLEGLETILHSPGSLRIALENGSTHLRVDGQPRLLSPSQFARIQSLAPGNHEIVVEGLGLPQRTEVIKILPGGSHEIPLPTRNLSEIKPENKWWGAWAGGALLLGGSIAILSGTGHSGSAWR